MIQDVDESLRQLMLGEFKKLEDSPIKDASQVSFGMPTASEADKAKKPTLNLYLHDVRENVQQRESGMLPIRSDGQIVGKQLAPVHLDLSYLVSVHGEQDPHAEHRILSDSITVALRNKIVPEKYLAGSLEPTGAGALMLSIGQPDQPAYANPPGLWAALGGQTRPMLGLLATAIFNPYETRLVSLVREAIFGIGQGTAPEGPDRPLDLRGIRVSAAGIVAGADGETPAPDVTVSVVNRKEQTTTDERGFFHIDNLPSGKQTLVFWKRGFVQQEVSVLAPPPGRPDLLEPIGVTMQPLADKESAEEERELAEALLNGPGLVELGREYRVSLVGKLRFADGRPAAYVVVRVGDKRTITDGEGRYKFTDVPAGDGKLTVEVPGEGDVVVAPKDGAAVVPAHA